MSQFLHAEADGGTVEHLLWCREMSRFNLRRADEMLKLAKRWGKAEEYASWWSRRQIICKFYSFFLCFIYLFIGGGVGVNK
jgi:hypothetical protein